MIRTVLVVTACVAALAVKTTGNPAAEVKEWRWMPRHASVSPNNMALPFSNLVKTYTPTVRIPGTKFVDGCGPTQPRNRNIGREEVVPHSYPWQVALFIDDVYYCGGTIINEEWILTAAHCMDGAQTVEVVAGAHIITEAEPSQVTMTSTEFLVHERWNSILLTNDISLIRLPQPLPLTAEIAPVCLPSYSATELPAGTWLTLTGWGFRSHDGSSNSSILSEVDVTVVSNQDCKAVYGPIITDNIICIDPMYACTGGSGGGPLNYVDESVTYTRGIDSFDPAEGCESGIPKGGTRVIQYLEWIESNTGIAIDP